MIKEEKTHKIYLLLTKFPDTGSKIIEMLTGGHYPHASIGLEEDMNTFYSFVTKGFIVEKVSRYVKPGRTPYPCQLYELAVPEQVYHNVKQILRYFVSFTPILHYSKWGLVLSLLHIPYRRDRFGFFCTQFVAHVLQTSGAAKLRKRSIHCFSNDLKELPNVQLIYHGNMQRMLDYFQIAPV